MRLLAYGGGRVGARAFIGQIINMVLNYQFNYYRSTEFVELSYQDHTTK